MTAQVLMVQGTASSVGKSLLVTALCRILRQDGVRVAPFKAQNMSNNSYVTRDGGEMGRAQVAQAEAAGLEPEVCMNPILLKPESDHRSQIVLNGRPYRTVEAGEYFRIKRELWPAVTSALDELRRRFDAVVIEGAGSPAEINLRAGDIVNMRVARYADASVLLVGDIDRGGVFAHLLGTLMLLEPEERGLVRALAINKFRGDPALLAPGLDMLTERTGLPIAGVIPYLHDPGVADEDAVALDGHKPRANGLLDIAVIQFPHISNFDDFDPLESEPGVRLRYVSSPERLGTPDLVILPGSKATVADLLWLRERGLDRAVARLAENEGAIVGVCGGYQMLGRRVLDGEKIESSLPKIDGLGLLPVETDFAPVKSTHQVRATVLGGDGLLSGAEGLAIEGYEIHMGLTRSDGGIPFLIDRRSGEAWAEADGAISADGWILGTYLHGLFANDGLRRAMLANLAGRKGVRLIESHVSGGKEAAYDRLASHVRASLNMDLIHGLMRPRVC
ncbi:MAG: cobyric acid synthase [Dehalococcoidia bacterium]